MPIPYKPRDMVAIGRYVRECLETTSDEEFEERRKRDQAIFDGEWRHWLAQYDDDGNLRPGVRGTPDFIPNRSIAFLGMSAEERKVYILSEKKRMGML